MKEIESVGNAFEELETVKKRLTEVVKSKGYQELAQWESTTDATNIISAGMNEKLTESLMHSLSVISIFIKHLVIIWI